MVKYKTLDQHIKFDGRLIEPGTVVNVKAEDVPVWDKLVAQKVAEKVATKKKKTESAADAKSAAGPEAETKA